VQTRIPKTCAAKTRQSLIRSFVESTSRVAGRRDGTILCQAGSDRRSIGPDVPGLLPQSHISLQLFNSTLDLVSASQFDLVLPLQSRALSCSARISEASRSAFSNKTEGLIQGDPACRRWTPFDCRRRNQQRAFQSAALEHALPPTMYDWEIGPARLGKEL
jgi:hypothetical protein